MEVSDRLFDVPMNGPLVHQALVMYEANKRQGTHSTKTKAQVSGGGRKPWPQKHTGRARHGSNRSPQWRHGGVVFGPHPGAIAGTCPKGCATAPCSACCQISCARTSSSW